MHGVLRWKPYKTKEIQNTNHRNYLKRLEFSQWIIEKCTSDSSFASRILFGDEKWFVLDSAPNSQNTRHWAPVQPNNLLETRYQGKKKVLCWVGILNNTVLGPYWFVDDRGNPTSVSQVTYLEMLENKLWPDIENRRDIRRVYFQQDGAPPHTGGRVLEWLQERFQGRIISQRCEVPWPPQSPDLNPLDFWFWGNAQSEVHRANPETIEDVQDCVQTFAAMVTPTEIAKTVENFVTRVKLCHSQSGAHFQHSL